MPSVNGLPMTSQCRLALDITINSSIHFTLDSRIPWFINQKLTATCFNLVCNNSLRHVGIQCNKSLALYVGDCNFLIAHASVTVKFLSWLRGKLQFYGMHGPLLDWTASFLKTRTQSVVADGKHSKPARVLSGVPQGTVLGPLLFLLHINNLPSVVTSSVRLFADDCLLYRSIRCAADQVAFQRDLSVLQHWGDTWGMRFNAGKCHIMQVHRGQPLVHFYTLCGQVLSLVEEAKYLGVLLASDLGWLPHIASDADKASSALDFLKRNLKKCPAALKERAYTAYVRSILDYASPIWDPHLKKDILALERVNRRAARYVIGDYHRLSSVSGMLRSLGWSTLEDQRREARLTLFYKILKEKSRCRRRISTWKQQTVGRDPLTNLNLRLKALPPAIYQFL